MIAWNVAHMFKLAGGCEGVVKLCARFVPTGEPPALQTAAVWKHRDRISAEWLPVVVAGLLAAGHPPAAMFRKAEAPGTGDFAQLGLSL